MQTSTIRRAIPALVVTLSFFCAAALAAADDVKGGNVKIPSGKDGAELRVNEEILLILRKDGTISEER